jgi:hypothetical protein
MAMMKKTSMHPPVQPKATNRSNTDPGGVEKAEGVQIENDTTQILKFLVMTFQP